MDKSTLIIAYAVFIFYGLLIGLGIGWLIWG